MGTTSFLLFLFLVISCQVEEKKTNSEMSTIAKAPIELDALLNKAFTNDFSCSRVFTGNAGNYASAKFSYARTFAYSMIQDLCSEDFPGSVLDIFQRPAMNAKDALSLEEFNKGANLEKSRDNLIATYALAYALGQRESNGNFSEGRDITANNIQATTEEAGLIQVSVNSLNLKGTKANSTLFLRTIFQSYMSSLSFTKRTDKTKLCLSDKLNGENESKDFDISGERLHQLIESGVCNGVSETVKDLNFKISDGLAACFRELNKECPSFAIKYGAAVARIRRDHNGPLILHEEFKKGTDPKYLKPYLIPSCHGVFKILIKLDQAQLCKTFNDQSSTIGQKEF